MSQVKVLAALELRDDLCPCGCGQPREDLQLVEHGKTPDLTGVSVDRVVCKYRARLDLVERLERDKHEKSPEKLDGVLWVARPYDPERDKAMPTGSGGKRSGSSGASGRGRLIRGQ